MDLDVPRLLPVQSDSARLLGERADSECMACMPCQLGALPGRPCPAGSPPSCAQNIYMFAKEGSRPDDASLPTPARAGSLHMHSPASPTKARQLEQVLRPPLLPALKHSL